MIILALTFQEVLLSVLLTVLTGLVGIGIALLKTWINTKIKDENAKKWFNQIVDIISTCVNEVSQTYVDALKDKDMFTEEAQKEALSKCLEKVKSQLTTEGTKFIEDNYGDVENWLTTQIESTIKKSK